MSPKKPKKRSAKKKQRKAQGELTDEQLQNVAGGAFLSGASGNLASASVDDGSQYAAGDAFEPSASDGTIDGGGTDGSAEGEAGLLGPPKPRAVRRS